MPSHRNSASSLGSTFSVADSLVAGLHPDIIADMQERLMKKKKRGVSPSKLVKWLTGERHYLSAESAADCGQQLCDAGVSDCAETTARSSQSSNACLVLTMHAWYSTMHAWYSLYSA